MKDLTKDDQLLALRVMKTLKAQRNDEPILAAHNFLTATEIRDKASKAGITIIDPQLRWLMNWLRKNKYPVGSSQSGYFYILSSNEFGAAIQNLVSRARDLENQIREMREAQTDMFKRERSLFDDPKTKAFMVKV